MSSWKEISRSELKKILEFLKGDLVLERMSSWNGTARSDNVELARIRRVSCKSKLHPSVGFVVVSLVTDG